MLKFLNKTSNFLDKSSRIVAIPMIASFFLLILFGVFTRFVLRRPMLGVSDYSQTSFVWSCFLGAAILFKGKEHIAIKGFVDMLPEKFRKSIALGAEIIELLFFIYVMKIGISITGMVHVTRMVATGMRQSVLYSAVPVSMFICAVHTLSSLFNQINAKFMRFDPRERISTP